MVPPDLEPAPVVRLDTVDSTQEEAFALAASGAPDGTAVTAESQRAGRGRRGRVWVDEPGASLLVSVIMRPRLAPARRPLLSIAAGLAVVAAARTAAGVEARLAWPNDVHAGEGKVAGILLESRGDSRGGPIVVAGIGVNVNQLAFPAELARRATSLRLAAGRPIDRGALLAALLHGLAGWRARLEEEGFAPLRAAWLSASDTLGRTVTAADGATGLAVGLDDDGALLLADGARRWRVLAGEVMEEAADAARGRGR